MRQIGRTQDGQHIVTMTEHEARALDLLRKAADGKIVGNVYPMDVVLDTNMANTFIAVRLWIEQTNTVNELQASVNAMRRALGVEPVPGACTCDPTCGDGCSECTH